MGKEDRYVTVRIKKEDHRKLKIMSAKSGESMMDVFSKGINLAGVVDEYIKVVGSVPGNNELWSQKFEAAISTVKAEGLK